MDRASGEANVTSWKTGLNFTALENVISVLNMDSNKAVQKFFLTNSKQNSPNNPRMDFLKNIFIPISKLCLIALKVSQNSISVTSQVISWNWWLQQIQDSLIWIDSKQNMIKFVL